LQLLLSLHILPSQILFLGQSKCALRGRISVTSVIVARRRRNAMVRLRSMRLLLQQPKHTGVLESNSPPLMLDVLSQHAIREAHISEHHQRSLRAAASLPGIERPSLDTPGHLPSAQCYHNCSTFFQCKVQPRICCIRHCLDQLTVCE